VLLVIDGVALLLPNPLRVAIVIERRSHDDGLERQITVADLLSFLICEFHESRKNGSLLLTEPLVRGFSHPEYY
jgi:hypothetical protein